MPVALGVIRDAGPQHARAMLGVSESYRPDYKYGTNLVYRVITKRFCANHILAIAFCSNLYQKCPIN